MDSAKISHILKWLCLPSLHGNPQRVHQIEMVIWEQDDNWSQWLWIVRLGESVKLWQWTSCVAVSWYKKNSLFPLERQKWEKETERGGMENGMGEGKSTILLSPQLPQLGFTSCSWYSWSKCIIIIKHVLGSERKQRHSGIARQLICHSTVQYVSCLHKRRTSSQDRNRW